MIVAHILGIPIEETASQLVPLGATVATALAIIGRAHLRRVAGRLTKSRP